MHTHVSVHQLCTLNNNNININTCTTRAINCFSNYIKLKIFIIFCFTLSLKNNRYLSIYQCYLCPNKSMCRLWIASLSSSSSSDISVPASPHGYLDPKLRPSVYRLCQSSTWRRNSTWMTSSEIGAHRWGLSISFWRPKQNSQIKPHW